MTICSLIDFCFPQGPDVKTIVVCVFVLLSVFTAEVTAQINWQTPFTVTSSGDILNLGGPIHLAADFNPPVTVMLHDVRGARQPQRRAMASSLAPEESFVISSGKLNGTHFKPRMGWHVVAMGVNPWAKRQLYKSPEGATCVSMQPRHGRMWFQLVNNC